jgi:hypothetical protein
MGYTLITFVACVGLYELLADFGILKMVPTTSSTIGWMCVVYIFTYASSAIVASANFPSFFTILGLTILTPLWIFLAISILSEENERKRDRSCLSWKKYVRKVQTEWKRFKLADIKRQDDYPPLSKKEFALAGISFLLLLVVLIICITTVAKIPGLDVLNGVLK